MDSKLFTASCLVLLVTASGTFLACQPAQNIAVELDLGTDGTGGDNTADAGTDAADDGPTTDGGDSGCDLSCEGECVPFHPLDFSEPFLAWIGADPAAAPACPVSAPIERPALFGDLTIPPAACSECTCGPSYGSCELPSTIWTQAAPCNAPAGAPTLPTDAPIGWDGTCTSENPIPGGLSCGPGNPCTQAVWIDPIAIPDEACTAQGTSTADLPPPTWGLFAKACEGSAFGECLATEHCSPAREGEFRQCVQQPGIHECPIAMGLEDEYTERFVLYEDFLDTRACSSCYCGTPQDSYCLASIGIYADASCSSSVVSGNIWSKGPICHDVAPLGQAIGSKIATTPAYIPGTCEASGGELSGDVALLGARTFCCLP